MADVARYSTLTAEQRTFYEMEMLMRAVGAFTHLSMAQMGIAPATQVPENSGDTINWRRMSSLAAVTTPLTEGITPEPHDISITSVTATVQEYGAYVYYTRKLALMGIDRVAAEAADALGEQAGDSLDQLVRDVIVAGTTVQYAGTATQRSAVSEKLTAAEILEAVATLKANKALPVADGKYYVIIHPYTEYDIMSDSTFKDLFYYVKERGDENPLVTGYIGDALGCRFFVSPNAKYWVDAGAGNKDVYATMVIGKGAFGIGGLAGYMPAAVRELTTNSAESANTGAKVRPLRLIQKDFGSAGTSDPLNQRATIAWYTTFTTARLLEWAMVRIEHTTTLGG
jgi:N4-gp56 family major capsid protein